MSLEDVLAENTAAVKELTEVMKQSMAERAKYAKELGGVSSSKTETKAPAKTEAKAEKPAKAEKAKAEKAPSKAKKKALTRDDVATAFGTYLDGTGKPYKLAKKNDADEDEIEELKTAHNERVEFVKEVLKRLGADSIRPNDKGGDPVAEDDLQQAMDWLEAQKAGDDPFEDDAAEEDDDEDVDL